MPSKHVIATAELTSLNVETNGDVTLTVTGLSPHTIPAAYVDSDIPPLATNPNTSGSGFWEWLEKLRKRIWS